MPSITRRIFIATSSAALAAHRATADDLPPNERQLYDAAKREGEITWYSGQIQSEPADGLPGKSAVCGLNGLRPMLRVGELACGLLYSSERRNASSRRIIDATGRA